MTLRNTGNTNTIFIILFSVSAIINIGIVMVFVYFKLKRNKKFHVSNALPSRSQLELHTLDNDQSTVSLDDIDSFDSYEIVHYKRGNETTTKEFCV